MKIRLIKAAKTLNTSTKSIVSFLSEKGFNIDHKPTAILSEEMYRVLISEFSSDPETMKKFLETNKVQGKVAKNGPVKESENTQYEFIEEKIRKIDELSDS